MGPEASNVLWRRRGRVVAACLTLAGWGIAAAEVFSVLGFACWVVGEAGIDGWASTTASDAFFTLLYQLGIAASELSTWREWLVGTLLLLTAFVLGRALRPLGVRSWSWVFVAILVAGGAERLPALLAAAGWTLPPFLQGGATRTAIEELTWAVALMLALHALLRSERALRAAMGTGAWRYGTGLCRAGQATILVSAIARIVLLGVGAFASSSRAPLVVLVALEWSASMMIALWALRVAGLARPARTVAEVGAEERAAAECVRCWHPLGAAPAEDGRCAECGWPVQASRETLAEAPTTRASRRWNVAVGQVTGLIALALCGSIVLSVAQAIEASFPAVGWSVQGSVGTSIRLAIDSLLLMAAWRALQGRASRNAAAAVGLLAVVEVAAVVAEAWWPSVSMWLSDPSGGAAMVAVHALGGAALCLLILRVARHARSGAAFWAALAAFVALWPFLVVAIIRARMELRGSSDPGIDHLRDAMLIDQIRTVEARAAWIVVAARHLWELPLLAAAWLIWRSRRSARAPAA